MPSYCQRCSIWKLFHCCHPFYSAAFLQEFRQHSLITLFHLTPQVLTAAMRTALDVTGSISPGNLLLLHHQCIIMCSTSPPHSHVQSLTCTVKVTSCIWTPRVALSHLSENRNCVSCLHRQLPRHILTLTISASVIKNANWKWQSNREFYHREIEWNSLAKIYGRESTECLWLNSLVSVVVCHFVYTLGDGCHLQISINLVHKSQATLQIRTNINP